MQVVATIRLSLDALKRYRRGLDQRNEKVFFQWAVRYRSFVQRRFNEYSRGSGDWPPLKSRDGSILRDTGTLFNTMAPQISAPPGSINRLIRDGIEVGYGGSASHPGGPTIAQIAYWHQTGAGNNPKREIIVEPDAATVRGMLSDMRRAHNA